MEEALNSLEGIQRAKANPFLYTRIRQRLQPAQRPTDWLVNLAARPAFAAAIVIGSLATNLLVASLHREQRVAKEIRANEQLFAAEYDASNILSNETGAR